MVFTNLQGGFSALPGTEAHGGYTFCGFASIFLLNKTDLCDLNALLVCVHMIRLSLGRGGEGVGL